MPQSHLRVGLETTAREYLLDTMPADSSGELSALDLREMLAVFFNWRGRLIPARPRSVHISDQLQTSPNATQHKGDLDALIAEIVAGGDLTRISVSEARWRTSPAAITSGRISVATVTCSLPSGVFTTYTFRGASGTMGS